MYYPYIFSLTWTQYNLKIKSSNRENKKRHEKREEDLDRGTICKKIYLKWKKRKEKNQEEYLRERRSTKVYKESVAMYPRRETERKTTNANKEMRKEK